MKQIIPLDRSIIPACDVDIAKFEQIVKETAAIEKVGAYKIGFKLALENGLPRVVETARKYTTKPIIYDHQKAGTDIPDTGKIFMESCKNSGIDAVIIFPQAGPLTEAEWITAAQEAGLEIIVGGEMTHPLYLMKSRDGDISEKELKAISKYDYVFQVMGANREGKMVNGFIRYSAPEDMYEIAAIMGVKNFVVPGNKPESIQRYRNIISASENDAVFFAPGFVTQGGDISEGAKAAGDKFHAIVGRDIYNATDIQAAVAKLINKL